MAEAQGAESQGWPCQEPSAEGRAASQMQVIQSESIFPEQIILIPTPSRTPSVPIAYGPCGTHAMSQKEPHFSGLSPGPELCHPLLKHLTQEK